MTLVCLTVPVISAQTIGSLVDKYALRKNVVTVMMPESVLRKIARRDDNDLLRKLTEIQVVSITAKEGESLREDFVKDAGALIGRCSVLYSVSNDGRRVSAYIADDGSEAVTLSSDEVSVTLLYMRGDIDEDVQDALLTNEIRIK